MTVEYLEPTFKSKLGSFLGGFFLFWRSYVEAIILLMLLRLWRWLRFVVDVERNSWLQLFIGIQSLTGYVGFEPNVPCRHYFFFF